jgi:hypothetical protein
MEVKTQSRLQTMVYILLFCVFSIRNLFHDIKIRVDPEKIKCPRIDWNDIVTLDLQTINPSSNDIDESNVKETDIEKTELDENND